MSEVLKPGEQTRKWFAVVVPLAHMGAGRTEDGTNFVYASNLVEALTKARKLRGWKRDNTKYFFPELRKLSEEEVKKLEETIRRTPNVTMGKAKKFGFYGRR